MEPRWQLPQPNICLDLYCLLFPVCLYSGCASKIFIHVRKIIILGGTKEMIGRQMKTLSYEMGGDKSHMFRIPRDGY